MALLYKSDSKIDNSDLAIVAQIKQRALRDFAQYLDVFDIECSIREFVALVRLNKVELHAGRFDGRPSARLEESFSREVRMTHAIVKSLTLRDISEVTFRDFCELSRKLGNAIADVLIAEYLHLIKSLRGTEQQKAIFAAFLGNDTYAQLSDSGGPELIISHDTVRELAPNHPQLQQACLEYMRTLINQFKVFEQADDFLREGIENSRYKIQVDRVDIEGYWVDGYRCEKAYQHAEQKRADIKSDEQKRGLMLEVQGIILREEKIGDSHRLPVPEEKPWRGAAELINCLKFFEAKSMSHFNGYKPENSRGAKRLRYLLSEKQRKQFLPLFTTRVERLACGGPGAILRLPPLDPQESIKIFRDASAEYEVKLNDGSSIRWTSTLKNYIRDWNIIPSRQFLERFQQLVKAYREEYSPLLPRLQQFLNELRARVEQDQKQAINVAAGRLLYPRPAAASAMPSADAMSAAAIITMGSTGIYGGTVSTTASIPAETPLLPRGDKQQTNCWPPCALL